MTEINAKTVKGHGFLVGDLFTWVNEAGNPVTVKLAKEGVKYALEHAYSGETLHTFGSTAKIMSDGVTDNNGCWEIISPVDLGDGVTVYVGKCLHGYETGFHTSADDATAVVRSHGKASRPLYVAPVNAPEVGATVVTADGEIGMVEARYSDRTVNVLDVATGQSLGIVPADSVTVIAKDMIKAAYAQAVARFCETDASTWYDAKLGDILPDGYRWAEVGDGEWNLFAPDGRNVSRGNYARRDVGAVTPPVIEGYRWDRHVNPGETVWAGSTYQLIVEGTACQVVATVTYRQDGLWAAQSCTWGNWGLTRDFWLGESLTDAFASVVEFMGFLDRARQAGMNGIDMQAHVSDWRTWAPEAEAIDIPTDAEVDAWQAEHDAGMDAWIRPVLPLLPVSARPKSAGMVESEVWAGTGTVIEVKRPIRTLLGRRKRKMCKVNARRVRGGF